MSNRPPRVPLSGSLPDDGNGGIQRLLETVIKTAARKCGVSITINIISNPGEVRVYDNSRVESREHTAHGDLRMTNDTYSAGQAGAMGPDAHAHDMTFQQVWNQNQASIDLPRLSSELGRLREAMRAQPSGLDQDAALGSVALAERAAEKGDGPSALRHLKSAGKWALKVSEQIGVRVAAAALKAAMEL